VLSVKLGKMEDSVMGKSNIDTKGYLTDLNSVIVNTEADIGDFKKGFL
jgi:pre-mRNA-processing factor 6